MQVRWWYFAFFSTGWLTVLTRTEWKHWKCNTPGCEKVYRVAPRMHAANEFCFAPVSSSNKFDFEWIDRNCGKILSASRIPTLLTSNRSYKTTTQMLCNRDKRSNWTDPDHCLAKRQVSESIRNSMKLVTNYFCRGFLHHIRSNAPSSKILANEIFDRYQQDANEGDLKFRRWPMRAVSESCSCCCCFVILTIWP
jgi:hypothetical protein